MRTTISLEDNLLLLAKKRALEEQVSLAKYIEEAVRARLAEDARDITAEYRPIKTFKGNGLQEGVDLNDSRRLLDLMDDVG